MDEHLHCWFDEAADVSQEAWDNLKAWHLQTQLKRKADQAMKHELELVKKHLPQVGITDLQATCKDMRKALRKATEVAVDDALLGNNLTLLAGSSASLITIVASALVALEAEPETEDFVIAARELLINAQAILDKALHSAEWELDKPAIKQAAVMLEIIVQGICATMSIPYHKVFGEVLIAQVDNRAPCFDGILP